MYSIWTENVTVTQKSVELNVQLQMRFLWTSINELCDQLKVLFKLQSLRRSHY